MAQIFWNHGLMMNTHKKRKHAYLMLLRSIETVGREEFRAVLDSERRTDAALEQLNSTTDEHERAAWEILRDRLVRVEAEQNTDVHEGEPVTNRINAALEAVEQFDVPALNEEMS